MKGTDGRILYIGKAKNLRRRVQSYFRPGDTPNLKTAALVAQIADLEFMVVSSEVEALLLERNLIACHQPTYNILLRDDKQYPMVRIGWSERWPRLEVVRKKAATPEPKVEYIGPFAQVTQLNLILELVGEVFPLVRCSEYEFARAKRPCLYFHMNKCLAPCSRPVERRRYLELVEDAAALLRGKPSQLVARLRDKMWQFASHQQYEDAARLRDQIHAIESFEARQRVQYHRLQNVDVLARVVIAPGGSLCLCLCCVRDGRLLGHKSLVVDLHGQTADEAVSSFLLGFYRQDRQLPDTVYAQMEDEHEAECLGAALEQAYAITLRQHVHAPEVAGVFAIAVANARAQGDHAKIFARPWQVALEELARWVGAPHPLRRLECVDVSHMSGTATVAAVVCFVDGVPYKKHYRLYNIADEDAAQSDFSSIAKVLQRRFSPRSGLPDPDLLIIDGGKGQLSAACAALATIGRSQLCCIGLAKARSKGGRGAGPPVHTRERLVWGQPPQERELAQSGALTALLTGMRDEAHRFAITHHRRRRLRIRHAPSLTRIAGIGPSLRRHILSAYPDLEQLALDSPAEIARKVPRLSVAVAEKVSQVFQAAIRAAEHDEQEHD